MLSGLIWMIGDTNVILGARPKSGTTSAEWIYIPPRIEIGTGQTCSWMSQKLMGSGKCGTA
jgi:hypothetical protein